MAKLFEYHFHSLCELKMTGRLFKLYEQIVRR